MCLENLALVVFHFIEKDIKLYIHVSWTYLFNKIVPSFIHIIACGCSYHFTAVEDSTKLQHLFTCSSSHLLGIWVVSVFSPLSDGNF